MGNNNNHCREEPITDSDLPYSVPKYDYATKLNFDNNNRSIRIMYGSVTVIINIVLNNYTNTTIAFKNKQSEIWATGRIVHIKNNNEISISTLNNLDHSKILIEELEWIKKD
jgi:hypothetical protein